MPPRPGLSGTRWPLAASLGLVVLAALLAWHNSFAGELVYDDVPAIKANASILKLWPAWGPLWPGRNDLTVSGRPLANWTLALNHVLGGTAVGGYHGLNLAIHTLAGLTLLGLARRTLLLPSLRPQFGSAALPLALAIALLWVVHPLQTESVTYIIQRVEALMGLFYLLTLYCFVRGTSSPSPARWYLAAVAACTAGMASKEVMVSAPLLVLIHDRTFVAGTFRGALERRRWLYAGLAATWLLLAWLVTTTGDRGGSAGFGGPVGWREYALVQCEAVVHYLRLSFWPHPLIFDYGLVEAGPLRDVVLPGLMLAALLAGTFIALGQRRPIGFAGAWFFLILAPSSSVLPVVTEPIAEHRMYLPLAAVVALAVLGAFRGLGLRSLMLCAALAAGLGWVTVQRNRDYRDALTLWADTAHKCPGNARAHNNLGSLWLEKGNHAEAIRRFSTALQLQPHYASAHYNLGVALMQTGRPAEALPHFAQALHIEADFTDARVNWGNALLKLNRPAEAVAHYEAALALQPGSADILVNLGYALDQSGHPEEAMRQMQAALRLQAGSIEAHVALAALLVRAGSAEQAVAHYQEAAETDPGHPGLQAGWAAALAKTGDVTAATRHYREALRQKPDDPGVHFAFGSLLAKNGELPEAIEELGEALRLDPENIGIGNNLGNALLMAGRLDEAIAQYERILQAHPQDVSVRENLAYARAMRAAAPARP